MFTRRTALVRFFRHVHYKLTVKIAGPFEFHLAGILERLYTNRSEGSRTANRRDTGPNEHRARQTLPATIENSAKAEDCEVEREIFGREGLGGMSP